MKATQLDWIGLGSPKRLYNFGAADEDSSKNIVSDKYNDP